MKIELFAFACVATLLTGACASSSGANATAARFNDMFPVWSPAGDEIAFASDRSGDFEIYVAASDGSDLRRLTNSSGRDAHPFWFPDGRRIAFQSPRNEGDVRIFVMDSAGADQRQIAETKGFCGVPTVSPDGYKIALMCSDSAAEPGAPAAPWRIFLMNGDGTDLHRITRGAGDDQVANWSPDGSKLVFWSNRSGVDQLYLLDVPSENVRQLTDGPFRNKAGVFTPDGESILFHSDRDGGWSLYSMPASGGAADKIAVLDSEHGAPYVSPDGRYAFTLKITDGGVRVATIQLDSRRTRLLEFSREN